MSRKPSMTIDQIEQLEKKGGQAPEELFPEAKKEDKRTEPKEFAPARGSNGLWVIKLSAGGKMPDILSGAYTTITKAQEAIATYIEQRDAKAAG